MHWALLFVHGVLILSVATADAGKVKFVTSLFRHGDRAPLTRLPNDDLNTPDSWPLGLGQLTKLGAEQHRRLGAKLRHEFADSLDLFGEDGLYDHRRLRVESSDVDRCLMSAQALLSTLYVPPADDTVDEAFSWRPLPVHSSPLGFDRVFRGTSSRTCPRWPKRLTAVRNRRVFAELFDQPEWQRVAQKVSKATGMEVNVFTAFAIHDTLLVQQVHKRTHPGGLTDQDVEDLYPLAQASYNSFFADLMLRQMTGTHILRRVVDAVEAVLERDDNADDHKNTDNEFDASQLRMLLLSGHDTTLGAFHAMLQPDLYDKLEAPLFHYASHFDILLYESDKIEVRLDDVIILQESAHDFVKRADSLVSEKHWETMCGAPSQSMPAPIKSDGGADIFGMTAITLILFCVGLGIYLVGRKKKEGVEVLDPVTGSFRINDNYD